MNAPPVHNYGIPTAPAPLSGVEGLTRRNEVRLIWWSIRFRLHGVGGWWFAVAAIAIAILSAWITRGLGIGATVTAAAAVLVAYPAGVMVFIAAGAATELFDKRLMLGGLANYLVPWPRLRQSVGEKRESKTWRRR